MEIIRISSKGQVVLPKNIREQLALETGRQLKVELAGDSIILEPVEETEKRGWRRWGGAFRGSGMLDDLLAEHRIEVERDEKNT